MSPRAALAAALLLTAACAGADTPPPEPTAAPPRRTVPGGPQPDVMWVGTPPTIVTAMLKLAGVTAKDRVFDLGSGDGRIVIAAAKEFGASGVGVELDRRLIKEAQGLADSAGVGDKVEFRVADIFADDLDLRGATVVTLYLLPSLNARLLPKFRRDLSPGTRIVSHSYELGDWPPTRSVEVDGRLIHLWVIPPR